MSDTVYVPGAGFRPASALRLAGETVAREGERGLMVLRLISSSEGTELSFEIDDQAQADRVNTAFGELRDMLVSMDVRLRDESGAEYRPRPGRGGLSMGQCRFGFFARNELLEPLPPHVRRVTLQVRGGLGDWDVPIEVRPIGETDAARRQTLDVSQEIDRVTVRVTGFAATATETVLDIEATAAPPARRVRGVGSNWIRINKERLALVDERGRRYEELEPHDPDEWRARHPWRRNPDDDGSRTLAVFPPLPEDARELFVSVPLVIVEEAVGDLEIALPVDESRSVRLGPYAIDLIAAKIDDARYPDGTSQRAICITLGPGDASGARTAIKPARFVVNGKERLCGWAHVADPHVRRYQIALDGADAPAAVTLRDAVVEVRGPWEIRFTRPD
ncbi:MAG TPA: hypothetical protein VGQ86_00240 [Candidatus Limnocylindria bacterium]|nr:hypothetical protein [Candidatus Limnocylindria bacterium]